jgi:hypothetical protein
MSRRRAAPPVRQIQDDLLMPGQFEGFGHRTIFMQQQVEAAIELYGG